MILVTGAAGYIGSHVVLALKDRGLPVAGLDNFVTGSRLQTPVGIPFLESDCADQAQLSDFIRRHSVDLVIHCAGLVSVAESVAEPLLYYDANVCKLIDMIEGAVTGGATRLLFSSTATVYGAADHAMLHEHLPVAPINPYAASKAMAERILTDLAQTGRISVGILRYFNVAGADPAGRAGQISRVSTHLIKIAAEVAVGCRDHIAVTGTDFPTPDGTGIRDYVHVTDLAEAHVAAAEALRAKPGHFVMNVGYGRGFSVLEVLDAADRVCGRPLPRRMAPRRPGDVARLVADPGRIRAELGWTPRLASLERIVADAIAWEQRLRSLSA